MANRRRWHKTNSKRGGRRCERVLTRRFRAARLFLVCAAILLGDAMSAISVVASSRCRCGRATSHIHYSTNHDRATRASLVILLLTEGLSFLAAYVRASVRLYLASGQIDAYQYVSGRMAEATAPYAYLNTLAMGLEVLLVFLLIAAAATLHSGEMRDLHRVTVYGAVVVFLSRWTASTLYVGRTTQAVAALNIDPDTLRTANDVQSQFAAQAGFWQSQTFNLLTIALSLLFLALAVFAAWELHAMKVVSVWPSVQPGVATMEPTAVVPLAVAPAPPALEPPAPQSASTKFCRFCGAKILRDSGYCEECGKRLT
jgi:hypothetical protein